MTAERSEHRHKRSQKKQGSENLVFVKTCRLYSPVQSGQRREQRGTVEGKQRKKKKRKAAAIFVIAFFASAERKVVGKVLRNLNSFDSQGVVILIFSNREKTPLL